MITPWKLGLIWVTSVFLYLIIGFLTYGYTEARTETQKADLCGVFWPFYWLSRGWMKIALRATNPKVLAQHPNPIGPDNGMHLAGQILEHQIGIIVAAWGAHPITSRFESVDVLKMALRNAGALCLGMTKDGSPRHPLYIKNDQPLIPWKKAA